MWRVLTTLPQTHTTIAVPTHRCHHSYPPHAPHPPHPPHPQLPIQFKTPEWPTSRAAWIRQCESCRTIRDVVEALIDLDNHLPHLAAVRAPQQACCGVGGCEGLGLGGGWFSGYDGGCVRRVCVVVLSTCTPLSFPLHTHSLYAHTQNVHRPTGSRYMACSHSYPTHIPHPHQRHQPLQVVLTSYLLCTPYLFI